MKPIFPESPQEWISSKPNKIYYNSKTEEFTSTIVTDEQVIKKEDLLAKAEKYYNDFTTNVLRQLSKEEEKVQEISSQVKLKDSYIDPLPLAKEKILLALPKSSVDGIKEKPDVETSGLKNKIYDLSNFFSRIEDIAKKMEDYQSQYVSNIFNNSTQVYNDVDFLLESESLIEFGSNLKMLIESNSVDFSKFKSIQISFGEKLQIKKVSLFYGIDEVNLKYLFDEFKNSYPQNRQQTMRLVFNLAELEQDILSNAQNYQTIVDNYFINGSKKREQNTNLIARSSSKGVSSSSNNSDSTKNYPSMKEVGRKSVKLLQQEILNSIYRSPCLTPEEKIAADEELENQEEKRSNFAKEFSISVEDAFFASLPNVLQQVAGRQGEDAEAALNELGRGLLNRLGVCGIGDLTSLVANTVFAYMNEQEYADELAKCAVNNLKNDKVSKLWNEVGRLGKNAEVLERYRKFVGDTIPPWKTNGYVPPDYSRDLRTDEVSLGKNNQIDFRFGDQFSANFSLVLDTPAQDSQIDFRFNSFKNAISLSITGSDLLDILVNTFPSEMGWLDFFVEATRGIINKCKGLPNRPPALLQKNWCDKRVSYEKIPESPRSNASFSVRPSLVTKMLIEEVKNTVINLTVTTVVSTMRQVLQIISAGISFDSDYFKQNQYVPDLFQSKDEMRRQIAQSIGDSSPNSRRVSSSVREIFAQKNPSVFLTSPISEDSVNNFLDDCSIGLRAYDKIQLYNGEAPNLVYDKVMELTSGTEAGRFFNNYSDVEKIFLEIGSMMDVGKIEKAFYQQSRSEPPPSVKYCGEDFDYLEFAYLRNKPEITDEQIQEMKETLKEIQKNKVCFAADTLGNKNGVILGQVNEIIKSKNGPIFGKVREMLASQFEPVIEQTIGAASPIYKDDLYKSQGMFDLIMSDLLGIGKNRRSISSFFAPAPAEDLLVNSLQKSKITSATYSPIKAAKNIEAKFFDDTGLGNNNISYIDLAGIVTVGSGDSSIFQTNKTFGEFETGANRVLELLEKNQDILGEDLSKKVSKNFITNGVMTEIVNGYFDNVREKLTNENRTYDGSKWGKIYDRLQVGENRIDDLLGKEKLISDSKSLYKNLEDFETKDSYVPFNVLESKEQACLSYPFFLLLAHTITSEILLKSLPVYEAFGYEILENYELVGDLVYKKFNNTLSDSKDKRLLALEKLVQSTVLAINAGVVQNTDVGIIKDLEKINQNIKNWVQGKRGNRIQNLLSVEESMENIARFFVDSSSKEYIREFQEKLPEIEGSDDIPSIKSVNSVSNLIFKESGLGSAKNVFDNVEDVGELSNGLRLEKFINLKGAKEGLPSGVQNLNSFNEYLKESKLGGKISDNWSSWSFGLRISSIFDYEKAGVFSSEIPLSLREKIKGFTLESGSESEEKVKYFLSPLIVYEKEISDQDISSSITNQFDEQIMIDEMSKTKDFLHSYYRGMNIENLISLITIYSEEEFGNFLYDTSDPFNFPPSTVRLWKVSGEKLLENTKKFIVNSLEKI